MHRNAQKCGDTKNINIKMKKQKPFPEVAVPDQINDYEVDFTSLTLGLIYRFL